MTWIATCQLCEHTETGDDMLVVANQMGVHQVDVHDGTPSSTSWVQDPPVDYPVPPV